MAPASLATLEEAGERWGQEVISQLCLRKEVQSSQGKKERNLSFFSSGVLSYACSLLFVVSLVGVFWERVCTHHFSSPTWPSLTSSLSEMIQMFSVCTRNVLWAQYSYSWCQMSQECDLRLKYFSFRLRHWNVDPSSQEIWALSSCACLTPGEVSFYSSMSRNELCKQQWGKLSNWRRDQVQYCAFLFKTQLQLWLNSVLKTLLILPSVGE